jgi:signal transduction histidine kinase
MSTSAIELSNNRPLLWLDRARGLFNGIGYVTAVGVILACLWTLNDVLPEIFAGRLRLAAAHFVTGLWESLLAQIPGPILIPIAVNLAPRSGVRRVLWLFAAAVPMALWCLYFEGATHAYSWDARSVANLLEGLLTTSLVVGVCAYHSHSRGAADALLRTQIDRTSLDAELQRAHLKLLHAQIEPHFLFNSLSAVRALARIDRSGAVEMLDNLIRYFEAALPRLREEDVPLAQEMQLIDAYLGIFRVRMGARLAYEVVLPKNLETVRVPSMMLLTLVENALKHGVNAAVEGGFIRVSAKRVGDSLLLRVADSGCGLSLRHGHGTGLANVSQRLLLTYGERGILSLRDAEPRGTVASISIPIQ